MLRVVSVTNFSGPPKDLYQSTAHDMVPARRGGFVHGTKVATTIGWKPVERIVPGDLIRTLDHGFREVRRITTDPVVIPAAETRADNLPVLVPARAAYNGRPVWLMPEQGIALSHDRIGADGGGISVVSARMLNGACRLNSQAPATSFDVSALFFDQDEVIFIEGGIQAFCPAGRYGSRSPRRSQDYEVASAEQAAALVEKMAVDGDLSAVANPLGALPALVPQEPIFPARPAIGTRRRGRPGRPNAPVLFLRREWLI